MFVFYDLETTSLDKDFSQILQIALVFTDENMNILSSKKLECRRSPWVVPSPGALLTTGFTPDDLKNSKLSHFEMMQEVDQWVRAQHWPVIFAGYNNIGYDEPVLASNLHQNLLDPHLTTAGNEHNTQRNGRSDVMNIVKAVYTYMPGALTLTEKNEFGSIGFGLGMVARQNGVALSEDDAHDAMNDIKATVGVAKLCQKTAPEIWDQMTTLSTSDGVAKFMAAHDIFTHTFVTYGKAQGAVTAAAGDNMLFDLSIDPAPYIAMSAAELKNVLALKNGPFRKIEPNAQPILMPLELSDAVIPPKFNDKLALKRAALLKDAAFRARLAEALNESKPQPTKILPEQMLDKTPIDPALQDRLKDWMTEFNHATDWHDAALKIDDFYKKFDDDLKSSPDIRRFVQFAGRVLYENAPDELSAEKQSLMKRYVAARLLNPDQNAPYMTIPKARKELETIEQERAAGRPRWAHVTDTDIRSLKLYYTALEKECQPFIQAPPANDDTPSAPARPNIKGPSAG